MESTQRNTEALRQELECPLCLKILLDPLTTPCGHNFCRYCLHRSLEVKQECPMCRRQLFMDAQDHPVNALLRNLVYQSFHDEISERVKDLEEELRNGVEMEIPVFLSSEVAFPESTIHLHLYEKKYRWMARYCLQNNVGFGIVKAQNEDFEKLRLITSTGASLLSSAAMVTHGVDHNNGDEVSRQHDTNEDVDFEVHEESGEILRMRTADFEEGETLHLSSSSENNARTTRADENTSQTSGGQETSQNPRSPQFDVLSDDEDDEFHRGLQFLRGRVGCLISLSRAYVFPDGRCFTEAIGVKRFQIIGTRVQPDSGGLLFAKVRCLNEVDFIRSCSVGLSLDVASDAEVSSTEDESSSAAAAVGKQEASSHVEAGHNEAHPDGVRERQATRERGHYAAWNGEREWIRTDSTGETTSMNATQHSNHSHSTEVPVKVVSRENERSSKEVLSQDDEEIQMLFAYLTTELKSAMEKHSSFADRIRQNSEGGDPLAPFMCHGAGSFDGLLRRARKFSYWLSSVIPLSDGNKQRLLEATSTLDRLRLLKLLIVEKEVKWEERRWSSLSALLFGQGNWIEGKSKSSNSYPLSRYTWMVRTFLLYAAICIILWDSLGASWAIPFTLASIVLAIVVTSFRRSLRSILFPNDVTPTNETRRTTGAFTGYLNE